MDEFSSPPSRSPQDRWGAAAYKRRDSVKTGGGRYMLTCSTPPVLAHEKRLPTPTARLAKHVETTVPASSAPLGCHPPVGADVGKVSAPPIGPRAVGAGAGRWGARSAGPVTGRVGISGASGRLTTCTHKTAPNEQIVRRSVRRQRVPRLVLRHGPFYVPCQLPACTRPYIGKM